jgi:methylmalonyl-CoA mutase, N-terminal domain
LHTNGQDEALSLPTEQSARLALRTQQVIAYESGVAAVPDPFGGSEYIEKLTDEIEAGAREYIARIDALGGTLSAIERGYIQSEIQNSAYRYQREIEEKQRIVVGVNQFQSDEVTPLKPFRLDPQLERQQVERLRNARQSRSAEAVCAGLARLEQAAQGTENLMPCIFECCRVMCTVGEISDTLRKVFGEYHESF